MIERHVLEVKKQAIYYTQGDFDKAKSIWFVLHGYGMLAQYFIRKFSSLNDTHFVIAPEAFSKFYLKGFRGRVGATWMTTSNREEEIQDYIHYLNVLYTKYYKPSTTINCLGFSQGGATLSRWFCNKLISPTNLIYWAGDFSNDMKFDLLESTSVQIMVSKQDEYVTPERILDTLSKVKDKIDYDLMYYKGGHTINPEALQEGINRFNW